MKSQDYDFFGNRGICEIWKAGAFLTVREKNCPFFGIVLHCLQNCFILIIHCYLSTSLGEVLLVSFLGKKAEGWKDGLTKTTDPKCVRTMSPAPVFWYQAKSVQVRRGIFTGKMHLKKIIFIWRIIAVQYCFGFCHTSTWISHRYTYVPPSWSSLLPLNPFPLLLVVTEPRFEFPEYISIGCLFYI